MEAIKDLGRMWAAAWGITLLLVLFFSPVMILWSVGMWLIWR